MRDDLIELLRAIDSTVLGERVRAARLRRGLTQAQVAGEAVSVGYVSRIESGQRRPDAGLLAGLADRLGVTVDELLQGVHPDRLAELRLRLDHAELALVTGSPADGLERVATLLDDIGEETLPELRRAARHLHARALEATGDLQAAILVLEDLAEQGSHDLQWIDGITALSRCYRESGELGRAIEVGVEATKRIVELELDGLDEAIRLNLTVAAAYFEQGDVAYAARLCQRAIDKAEAMASPVAKAMAYWNSSMIESLRGDASAALPMTQRALAIIEASDNTLHTARLRTQLGICRLLADPDRPEEALEALVQAEAELLATAGSASADLIDNQLAQARALWLLGRVEQACRRADETVSAASLTMPIVAADAHALLGRIAVSNDDLPTGRNHFQQAVLLLSGVGADRAAAQLWYELAGLFETVADPAAALDAYRRAGAASGLLTPAAHEQRRTAVR